MLIEEVRQLSTVEQFLYFVQEREAVRIKKEAGLLPPWTDDVILQKYRFCNVVRMDDRVSRWLLDHWYRPNYGHRNMLIACVLARFFNRPETLKVIGFPHRWRPDVVKRKVLELKGRRETVFNAAYIVTGTCGEKVAAVVEQFVHPLAVGKVKPITDSTEECHRQLSSLRGFGSFMAGQVVADLRWATPGRWADRLSWAPLGPGSRRGLNRLLDRPLKQSMKQQEFVDYLQGIIRMVAKELPPEMMVRMEAMDLQNCLCEYDKYLRCLQGEGRPKQTYPGSG